MYLKNVSKCVRDGQFTVNQQINMPACIDVSSGTFKGFKGFHISYMTRENTP